MQLIKRFHVVQQHTEGKLWLRHQTPAIPAVAKLISRTETLRKITPRKRLFYVLGLAEISQKGHLWALRTLDVSNAITVTPLWRRGREGKDLRGGLRRARRRGEEGGKDQGLGEGGRSHALLRRSGGLGPRARKDQRPRSSAETRTGVRTTAPAFPK